MDVSLKYMTSPMKFIHLIIILNICHMLHTSKYWEEDTEFGHASSHTDFIELWEFVNCIYPTKIPGKKAGKE
jgi:hypothetical protein